MVIEIVMFKLILFITGSIIISLLERWERSVMKIDGYNGFEGVFIDKEKGVEISNKMYNISCPIKYVHELQHALRLCGLSELADKFIIDT